MAHNHVRFHFKHRMYASSKSSDPVSSTEGKTVPKNLLEGSQTSHLQPENGAIFDKKPFKIHLEASKLINE